MLGRLTLLHFGPPKVTRNAVDWPIEGGLLARRAGGNWRLQAATGRIEATVGGYTPASPTPLRGNAHAGASAVYPALSPSPARARFSPPHARPARRVRSRPHRRT